MGPRQEGWGLHRVSGRCEGLTLILFIPLTWMEPETGPALTTPKFAAICLAWLPALEEGWCHLDHRGSPGDEDLIAMPCVFRVPSTVVCATLTTALGGNQAGDAEAGIQDLPVRGFGAGSQAGQAAPAPTCPSTKLLCPAHPGPMPRDPPPAGPAFGSKLWAMLAAPAGPS